VGDAGCSAFYRKPWRHELKHFLFVLMLLLSTMSVVRAQQTDGEMARFTILEPKDGMQKQFEDGY
jgi:hypothetical protein